MSKYIKTYEEYRYFPWTIDPGVHDREEPYWVWKKGKYKRKKAEKKATFGDIPIDETGKTFTVSDKTTVINTKKINDLLKKDNLSGNLINILKKIKEISLKYEQTDEYPPSFLKYENLDETDISKLKDFGFDLDKKNMIAWRWKG